MLQAGIAGAEVVGGEAHADGAQGVETGEQGWINIFDFMESEGYIRCKADASISSKDFYEIYRMWCEENSLAPLKARSFSDAMIANARKFNLEHCNNITNSAGRRVWGFMGVEAIARPHINGFYGDSPCTYVPEDIPEEWRQVE